jgi:xanthine dehydrogenase accessory factor
MEAEVIRTALSMLRSGEGQARLMEVELTAQAGEEEGMVCGGKIEVLLERIR